MFKKLKIHENPIPISWMVHVPAAGGDLKNNVIAEPKSAVTWLCFCDRIYMNLRVGAWLNAKKCQQSSSPTKYQQIPTRYLSGVLVDFFPNHPP